MDEEKRALFEKKRDMQKAKNMLKQLAGAQVMEIFSSEEKPAVAELFQQYSLLWRNNEIPSAARIPMDSPISEICRWILQSTDISANHEYYFYCGGMVQTLWARILIFDPEQAVESLWFHERGEHRSGYCPGFLIVDASLQRLCDVCCDSSDEYNYLLYIYSVNRNNTVSR